MSSPTGPIVSWLVNKYGCRTVTIAGAIVSSLGLGVSIFATNVLVLYITIGLVAGEFRLSFLSRTTAE